MTGLEDVAVDERNLRRFRRLVRSKIREHATRQKEAPGLTLWVSKGDRAGKAAPVRIGAARDAADVALRARAAMLEAEPAFAAIGRQLSAIGEVGSKGGTARVVSRTYGLVVASRSGLVETWQTVFTAGSFSAWESGEFDPGVTVDLLRSAWAEIDRRAGLRALQDRLLALEPDEAWDEKIGELGEGLESFLGNPLARAPREPEGEFTAYVESWLQRAEVHGV